MATNWEASMFTVQSVFKTKFGSTAVTFFGKIKGDSISHPGTILELVPAKAVSVVVGWDG